MIILLSYLEFDFRSVSSCATWSFSLSLVVDEVVFVVGLQFVGGNVAPRLVVGSIIFSLLEATRAS